MFEAGLALALASALVVEESVLVLALVLPYSNFPPVYYTF
jgi:hypothetical protein